MVGNDSQDAFIGAGDKNIVDGYASFIGSGKGNDVASASYSFVGSGYSNFVGGSGSAIVGGGYAGMKDTDSNVVTGNDSFLGAGDGNVIYGSNAVLGGGYLNSITGDDSFIGAGALNIATGNGSVVVGGGYGYSSGGGFNASNQATGIDSFVGAGDLNVAAATQSFIGSGCSNAIGSTATSATILGGNRNDVSGEYASVLGGYGNTASGSYAIVAGGDADTATGILSFVAGYHADATHNGSFVWSDYSSGSAIVKDAAANQFVVRASGGTTVYSNEGMTSGVNLSAGSGTWASLSDRNAKSDIVTLDDASILAKVSALPVSAWQYKSEKGVRHVGPMAQDFYAAFKVGEDDRHITSIDEDGIALSAIKALATMVTSQKKMFVAVRADDAQKATELANLRTRFAILEARVDAMATAGLGNSAAKAPLDHTCGFAASSSFCTRFASAAIWPSFSASLRSN